MEFLKYSVIVLLGIASFLIFVFSIKSKKFLRIIMFNAFMGLALLSLIDLTAKFTGVYIPVNQYTVSGGAVLGVPALCGFLLLKFIFI